MAYYLIDYENVKTHGLDGLAKLTENDTVCIFYSENADYLTFGLHKRLNEAKANIIYQKVEVGTKNALDFQLASYLGYIICENKDKNEDYYIVTKDNGFKSLTTYWSRRKVSVKIVVDVSGKNEKKEKAELTEAVEKVIKDKSAVPKIVKIIQQYKTKQGINNALIKEYKDTKKAGEVYSAIKSLLVNKKGK